MTKFTRNGVLLLLVTLMLLTVPFNLGHGITDVLTANGFAQKTIQVDSSGIYYLGVGSSDGTIVVGTISNATGVITTKTDNHFGSQRVNLAGGSYTLRLNGTGNAVVAVDLQNPDVKITRSLSQTTSFFTPPYGRASFTANVQTDATAAYELTIYDAFLRQASRIVETGTASVSVLLPSQASDLAYITVKPLSASVQYTIWWDAQTPQPPFPIFVIFVFVGIVVLVLAFAYLKKPRKRT